MFVKEVQDVVNVEVKVVHYLAEERVLHLGESYEEMLDADIIMLAPLAFLNGGVQNPLSFLTEVFF